MNRKNRDVKFLIYQSLYIFVICIIAIKGADLNLDQVELKKMLQPGYTYIDTVSNIILTKSEFANLMQIPDKDKYVIVEKSEIDDMKSQGKDIKIASNDHFIGIGTTNNPLNDNTSSNPDKTQKTPEIKEPEKIHLPGDIGVKQYAVNSLKNDYDLPMVIEGVTTIAPRSTGSFELTGQDLIKVRVGNVSSTYKTSANQKPTISIQRMASMGEDISVSRLQNLVGYRITIADDLPGQLDIKFSGPIQVDNKGNGVYDIKLKAFTNKSAFDNFIENKNEPYQIGFTVTVTDSRAGHKESRQQSFIFGEW